MTLLDTADISKPRHLLSPAVVSAVIVVGLVGLTLLQGLVVLPALHAIGIRPQVWLHEMIFQLPELLLGPCLLLRATTLRRGVLALGLVGAAAALTFGARLWWYAHVTASGMLLLAASVVSGCLIVAAWGVSRRRGTRWLHGLYVTALLVVPIQLTIGLLFAATGAFHPLSHSIGLLTVVPLLAGGLLGWALDRDPPTLPVPTHHASYPLGGTTA